MAPDPHSLKLPLTELIRHWKNHLDMHFTKFDNTVASRYNLYIEILVLK